MTYYFDDAAIQQLVTETGTGLKVVKQLLTPITVNQIHNSTDISDIEAACSSAPHGSIERKMAKEKFAKLLKREAQQTSDIKELELLHLKSAINKLRFSVSRYIKRKLNAIILKTARQTTDISELDNLCSSTDSDSRTERLVLKRIIHVGLRTNDTKENESLFADLLQALSEGSRNERIVIRALNKVYRRIVVETTNVKKLSDLYYDDDASRKTKKRIIKRLLFLHQTAEKAYNLYDNERRSGSDMEKVFFSWWCGLFLIEMQTQFNTPTDFDNAWNNDHVPNTSSIKNKFLDQWEQRCIPLVEKADTIEELNDLFRRSYRCGQAVQLSMQKMYDLLCQQ